MKSSKNCINLIKCFEGCRYKAYKQTKNDVWTIGYGHTENVKENDVITEFDAENFLKIDLQKFEYAINKLSLELNQNEFDALVSFVFNVGIGNFESSTMLKLLKAQKKNEAASQFDRWIYQGKTILPGLVKRRQAEKELFLRPTKWMQMIDYLD